MNSILRLRYKVYLPENYTDDEKWPLLLFLHGAGERGDDFHQIESTGLAHNLARGENIPFVVVAPQCPQDHWWPQFAPLLEALLDDTVAAYSIDETRQYVTGLSMGGFGTWYLAWRNPKRFAAIAPICGGMPWYVDHDRAAKALRRLPIWTFHGDADDVVSISMTQQMVDALEQAEAEVIFTVYPGVGHDSWTQTYSNPRLYEWFLEQRRNG